MTYIDSCHPGTHPSGSLRLSKLAPGQFVTWRVVVTEVNYQKTEIKKPLQMAGFSYLALDDDLLSHGEAPHYHRRCIVSLLSSGWDQVVPMLYSRQAICCCPLGVQLKKLGCVTEVKVFAISQVREVVVSVWLDNTRLLGCYMVKPHGQLVLVSSTPHSAYTPNLSTS